MPTLSQEQLTEIELERTDLFDQLDEKDEIIAAQEQALKDKDFEIAERDAAILRLRKERDG